MNEINKFTQNYHHGNFITPPPCPNTWERFIKKTLDVFDIYYGGGNVKSPNNIKDTKFFTIIPRLLWYKFTFLIDE